MQLKIELTDETDDAGRELFRLTDDFHCRICDGFSVVVPAGFVTNFGSVPRFFYRCCVRSNYVPRQSFTIIC